MNEKPRVARRPRPKAVGGELRNALKNAHETRRISIDADARTLSIWAKPPVSYADICDSLADAIVRGDLETRSEIVEEFVRQWWRLFPPSGRSDPSQTLPSDLARYDAWMVAGRRAL